MRLLSGILGKGRAASSPQRRLANRFRPQLERLEDRLVPSVTVNVDYTQYAQQYPPHPGPTLLGLNFDGWSDKGVSSFQSVTGNRDQDIQDILFRVSEIYAPFNVHVVQVTDNGIYLPDDGATTIFIGDNTTNGSGIHNVAHDFTPGDNSDFPGSVKGYFHPTNSDSYDVAFVDPIGWNSAAGGLTSQNVESIASGIAHEAGHTFGLGHVLTEGNQDIMSYDSANTRFINQSYQLTDLNYNGTSYEHTSQVVPSTAVKNTVYIGGYPYSYYTDPYEFQTQNSFAILKAVLGSRPNDDFANVVHTTSVDNGAYHQSITALGPRDTVSGSLGNGDYDVFSFTAIKSGQTTFRLHTTDPILSGGYNPELLVYNDNAEGIPLEAYSGSGAFPNSTPSDPYVTANMNQGDTLFVVVGGHEGWIGNYQLTVQAPVPPYYGLIPPNGGLKEVLSPPPPPSGPSHPLPVGGVKTFTLTTTSLSSLPSASSLTSTAGSPPATDALNAIQPILLQTIPTSEQASTLGFSPQQTQLIDTLFASELGPIRKDFSYPSFGGGKSA